MTAVGGISELADQPPLIALSAATIAAGLGLRNIRLARTGVRMLASHWLATKAKSFIKHRFDRTRPFVMLGGGAYHARRGNSHAKRENSFPSGHSAGAVAVARAIACDYPASAPVGYAAAGAAGLIQLPRGAHFLSDVLAGAAIGWLAEAAVRLILPATGRRGAEPASAGGTIIHPASMIEATERGEAVRDRAPALDPRLVAGERADPSCDISGRAVAVAPLDRERLGPALLPR